MVNMQNNNVGVLDRTGQQLGNYRLISPLEQSRVSGIYLSEHVQLNVQCIVRVWQTRLKEELVHSFLTESQALIKLIHPHILRMRDSGTEDLVPFVVMEYSPYITLRHRGPKGEPRALSDILPAINSVAKALQHVHDRGLVHKDIRPRNILLSRNNDAALLTNFAIDAVTRSEQQPNHLKATEVTELLGYIAPEQMQNRAIPASDQYALAVVIYEWLCGELPFHGSYGEIVQQQLHAQPPSLRQKVPTLSRAIEEVIFRALEKDPKRRFSDMSMFLTALQQAYNGAPALPKAGVSGVSSSAPRPFIPFGPNPPSAQQPVPVKQARPPVVPNPMAPIAAPMQPARVVSTPVAPIPPAPVQAPAQNMPAAYQRPAAPPSKSTPAPAQKTKKVSVTRRAFIAGLVGVAAVGGGVAWLELSRRVSLPQFGLGASTDPTPQVNTNSQADGGTSLIYRGHAARVSAVAWSPDGKRIASASDDRTVQVCDAKTGSRILIYKGHNAEVYAASWSPNGKYIASAGADKTVQVWDASTGALLTKYTRHTDQVNAVSWSSDSKSIASGSDDHTVQVWNISDGKLMLTYALHTAGVLCVAWSPDNTAIASGSWDNTIQAFSTIQTQSFDVGDRIFDYRGHAAEVYSVAWSPNGKRIASASADKVVQVGSGINGATIFSYMGHSDVVYSVAWSPDGTQLASASADKTIQVWSANVKQKTTSQKLFTYLGHSNTVYTVAWSPTGKSLASGSSDDTLQVWQPL